MDVDLMLEISSEVVRNTIKDKIKFLTNTIIPERFQVYEGNKRGILHYRHRKGKTLFLRSHYHVVINEICATFNCPLDIAYNRIKYAKWLQSR